MTMIGLHQDLHYWGEPYRSNDVKLAVTLGAKASRSTLLWDKIETSPGVFDWKNADDMLLQIRSHMLTPVLCPARWPSWLPGFQGEWVPPADFETAALAYARFCGAAAKRWKGKGVRWEIWNEQNEHYFWAQPDRALATRQYALLYTVSRAAIKSEISTAPVSVGGIAGLQAGGDGPGLKWLENFLRLVPPLTVDRVALHPYPSGGHAPDDTQPWQDNFTAIGEARKLLDQLGRTDVKLWVTEWGWNSAQIGEATQAQYVKKSLEMIRDLYGFLEFAVYFSDRDKGGLTCGLYDDGWKPKPAAQEFAKWGTP